MESETFTPRFGWIGDGGHLEPAAAHPALAAAAPGLVCKSSEDGGPILLYKAFRDVLGDYPAYVPQGIGDCVGFGHGHGLDLLQCVEIALGEASEFRESSTEFIYAASRLVAGLLGGPDGSYCVAAVNAMMTVGVVSREQLGAEGPYRGDRASFWGVFGPPAGAKALAASYKLGGTARITTWDELVAAMRNGYPVTTSTARGFEEVRDADGFCRESGLWGHCMLIGGVRFDRPGACLLQSWGPDRPVGPLALDQPSYSFWADRRTIEAMLAEGDSWALANAPAFVERQLPAHWSFSSAA